MVSDLTQRRNSPGSCRRIMNGISRTVLASLILSVLVVGGLPAAAQVPSPTADSTEKGAPYVPTPEHIALRMLQLADVSGQDVVYDLGSGDGRIVILAATEFGARGVGVEIDSQLVQKARRNAERAGVSHLVEFRQGNLFDVSLEDATVVSLYLWPDMNNRLRPKLRRELDPGDRVVSHSFDIDGWEADTTVSLEDSAMGGTTTKTLFRWTLP
jgi:SAM-dependent methyltransferase